MITNNIISSLILNRKNIQLSDKGRKILAGFRVLMEKLNRCWNHQEIK
jgi:hypothetical protein